jgi:hypothetical protein
LAATENTVTSFTKAPTVRRNQIRAKLPNLLLLIACFVSPSSNSWSCAAGQAAVAVSSPSGNQVANSHCSSYVSAYGVSLAQYQRIESNWKKFQSICPAPSPASVDFVLIFTHDVDYYNYTMPIPVHTDSSGFSNWSAIVLLDNTQPTEKSKREYVWVFRIKRGSYEPTRFPPNARPDYTQVESGAHASDRAVDAAFSFIAAQKG